MKIFNKKLTFLLVLLVLAILFSAIFFVFNKKQADVNETAQTNTTSNVSDVSKEKDFWILSANEGKLQSINISTGVVTDWLKYPNQGTNSDNFIDSPEGNFVVYRKAGENGWSSSSIILYDLSKKTEQTVATGAPCMDGPCDLQKAVFIGSLSRDGKYFTYFEKGKNYILDTGSMQKFLITNMAIMSREKPGSLKVNLSDLTEGKLVGQTTFPAKHNANLVYAVNSGSILSLEHIPATPGAKYPQNFGGARLVEKNQKTGERKVIFEDKLNRFFLLGPKN